MSWYFIAIEILCWVFIFVMLRHGIYRGRFLLHIFQQNGYKINEFLWWLGHHWNTILLPVPHLMLVLLAMAGRLYVQPWLTLTAITIVLIIFSLFWFLSVSRYLIKQVKKPLVFTSRMQRLALLFIILSIWIPVMGTRYAFDEGILFPDIYLLVFAWVFADLVMPWLLLLAAILIYPLELLIQYGYKRNARKKIIAMPDLKIIAITGSYGKTSTKFLIEALLKERYKVCTSPGSYNTPMGICKVINNNLQSSDQVLILEMGARYAGNIEELCRIASPYIAVITNVGVAHLESFGSQKAIAETKGALLNYLKPGDSAVLNGDDKQVRQMAVRKDIEVLFAGLSEQQNHLIARKVIYDERGCSFEMCYFQKSPVSDKVFGAGSSEHITMSLLGEHSIQNALLAAGTALRMGLRLPTIKLALQKVKPIEHRLELKKQNGVLILDDAFNSNPTGAKNAVSVLSSFKTGRKYVVTPGMIELGDRQDMENRQFGLWMSKHPPDHIFLVGKNQTRPIYEGLKEGGYGDDRITIVDHLFEANDQLKDRLKEGDVVLYENDLPDSYSV